MELEFEPDQDNTDVMCFSKTVHDSTELCLVCHVEEQEEGKQYDRYKLVCGHFAHTRCLRKWCGVKRAVNCPLCGDFGIAKLKEIYKKPQPGTTAEELIEFTLYEHPRWSRKQAIDKVIPQCFGLFLKK